MEPFFELIRRLTESEVQFVLIGVGGANYWAPTPASMFLTHDRDLFLPPDPQNLLEAWEACRRAGLDLYSGNEPLDEPRDPWLAERIVALRALTRANDHAGLLVDLTLVMAGFEFEDVWSERRIFQVGGVPLPVARLQHIIDSKRAVGRKKDLLFVETFAQSLQELLSSGPSEPPALDISAPAPGEDDDQNE